MWLKDKNKPTKKISNKQKIENSRKAILNFKRDIVIIKKNKRQKACTL